MELILGFYDVAAIPMGMISPLNKLTGEVLISGRISLAAFVLICMLIRNGKLKDILLFWTN